MNENTPTSLIDLPTKVGSTLRDIAAVGVYEPDPTNRAERAALARLVALGFARVADDVQGVEPTADGLRWLEHVGVAEPPGPDTVAIEPRFAAEIRQVMAEAGSLDFARVANALIEKGLDAVAHARSPGVLVSGIVRRVGNLLVWSDVVRACGIPNATQFARSRHIPLIQLPPMTASLSWGRGHPPRKGIEESQLDTLAVMYPAEVASIRAALKAGVIVQPEAPTAPKSGVYRITCEAERIAYVGATSNIARRWTLHRRQLATGQHQCRPLQEAFNRLGAEAFVYTLNLETGPHTSLAVVERNEANKAMQEGYNVVNFAELIRRRGRPPGSRNRAY